MIKKIIPLFLLTAFSAIGQGNTHDAKPVKYPNLAPTPPMGWNSWNTFETHIDEKLIRETADILVATGMAEAGYKYIVLDDGWMTRQRDKNGDLVPDPEKFPSGMRAVIDYVHSKGLKFGLYNCAGTLTCAGYPGTRGYEFQDARFYASLGIDFLKYDWCNTEGITAKEAYNTMSRALTEAGKPILFSLCEWGDNQPWEWGKPVGQMWRISGDISPCFDCEDDHGTWSSWGFMRIAEMRKDIRKYSGPEGWNDFDMMEVGNGMTAAEDRSHFAMWCMVASPLMAGNDLRKMSPETLKVLTNKELIAVNQDKLGIQGYKHADENDLEVWVKPLSDGWAVTFLNRSASTLKLEYDWKTQKFSDPDFGHVLDFSKETFKIKDLWTGKQAGTTAKAYKANLGSHDVITLKITK